MRAGMGSGGDDVTADEDSIPVEEWIKDVVFDDDPTSNVDRQGRFRRIVCMLLKYASRIPLPMRGVAYLLPVSRTVYQEFVLQGSEVGHCRDAED